MQKLVNINKIIVKNRKRELQDISDLKKSILDLGLLNPITINNDMTLIAGYHRLQACKELNFSEIPAIIIDADEIKAELMEIDENIIRKNLTALEQAEQLQRRKELFEKLHPQCNSEYVKMQNLPKRNNFASVKVKSFTKDTAQKIGKSQRSIQQDIQIANNISDEIKKEIKGTELENKKTALLKIAKTPIKQQKDVVTQLKLEEAPVNNKTLDLAYKVDFVLRKVVVDDVWLDLPPDYNMKDNCYSKMYWDANSYSKRNKNIR